MDHKGSIHTMRQRLRLRQIATLRLWDVCIKRKEWVQNPLGIEPILCV